jgi:hypothetical protein
MSSPESTRSGSNKRKSTRSVASPISWRFGSAADIDPAADRMERAA